ncbi:MAG: restriction endonuclease subunit S [Bacteroidales bacterium]|nr:restriction endonuclease subunit S [Bacteroidales bacterium]
MSYQIPQNIDNNKIFLINRSEIEGRLEPEFYRPSVASLEKRIRFLSSHRLNDYALSIAGGATPKKTETDKYYSDSESGIPFLRVQNLQTTGDLLIDDCIYINTDTHNGMLKRSQVTEGDLLVKITGVGRMAIASVVPKGFVGNTNQHMVVIKTGDASISKYLARYLNLDIIERIASRHSTGGTRPALDYSSLKNLPIIEGIDFTSIDNAIEEKKKKGKEAKNLIDGIGLSVLEELDIRLPDMKKQTLRDRVFTVNFSEIVNGRMDPRSVLFLGESAKSIKYENVQLKQIAVIEKGTPITSDDVNKEGQYPVVAGGQTSPYNHDKYNYNGDVITVSASGAYSGYVWYHTNPIFASDCSVIYTKSNRFLTKYIFEVLKAQQSYIYLLQQGAGQPHVYPDDLGQLWIPVVSLSKQQEIVDHIIQIRQKAKALQEEGADIFEQAKKDVEAMIIGVKK